MDKLRPSMNKIIGKGKELLGMRKSWEPKDTRQSFESQPEYMVRSIESLLKPLFQKDPENAENRPPSIGPEGFKMLSVITMRNEFRNLLAKAAQKGTRRNDPHYREIRHEAGIQWERIREIHPKNPSAGSSVWVPDMETDTAKYTLYYDGGKHEDEESVKVTIRRDREAEEILIPGDQSRSLELQQYIFGFYKDEKGEDDTIAIFTSHFFFVIDRTGTLLTDDQLQEWFNKKGRKPASGTSFSGEGKDSWGRPMHQVLTVVRRDPSKIDTNTPKQLE